MLIAFEKTNGLLSQPHDRNRQQNPYFSSSLNKLLYVI